MRLWKDTTSTPERSTARLLSKSGEVVITTVGRGTGRCKTFDELVGISVFKAVDVYIWNHVDGQGFVNHDPIP